MQTNLIYLQYNSDNFWAMGDTGPCGPCTEIFYDHGEDIWGGVPGSAEEDGDRYIEIWNNVFMQFNRQNGEMTALPKPSVDTGMGLERISAIMQNVHSNYEIDLFQTLLKDAAQKTGTTDLENKSLRVIADHIRSCAFLIIDGVMPSNEGRGYVLRRIIRRAIRHGHKLGQQQSFFNQLVAALAVEMGGAYPELIAQQAQIEKVLLAEEQQFEKTLDKGLAVLEAELKALKGKIIPGAVAFTLYDTYGFPFDLTADIARERELTIDEAGYEQAMEAQRTRARAAGSFKVDYNSNLKFEGETQFSGYDHSSGQAIIKNLLKDGNEVDVLAEGDVGVVILDQTPFYAESGGQTGDTGYLSSAAARFEVRACSKHSKHHLHEGVVLSGQVTVGDSVEAVIDADVRHAIALNHSATHLLHAALRQLLGEHVTQKGSLVDSDRLRFDFSHFEAINPTDVKAIEALVNDYILANTPVLTDVCDMESAKTKGAMALFGEKYGDEVRVLSMGDGFSVELCGGTHAQRTGDIGQIRIVSEAGVASGVRRIEAITGKKALAYFDSVENSLQQVASQIKTRPDLLSEKVAQLVAQNKQLEKDLSQLKSKLAASASDDVLTQAIEVQGIKVLAVHLDGVDAKSLREMADQMKNKLGTSVVLVASVEGDKVSLVAGVSKDATDRIKAGDLMRYAAAELGGKGGGRPDMAQGGGTDVSALPKTLASVSDWVSQQLG